VLARTHTHVYTTHNHTLGTHQLIFQSTSKKPESQKPPAALVADCPVGTLFAYTVSGSASQRTLDDYIAAIKAMPIFVANGGIKDEPGRRFVLKIDGGPALNTLDPAWLEQKRKEGVYIFPGLPNASAVNQGTFHSLID
jgi:hypothetical protein